DLAVYPGVRVAIAVDPVPAPADPTGEEPGDETDGAGETDGGEAGEPASDGEAPTTGGAPTSEGPEGSEPDGGDETGPPNGLTGAALPHGYGQHGEEGCGCRSSGSGGG